MRIYTLIASVAALAACGGSTAPLTAGAPDASSDVAIDHGGQVGPVNSAPSATGPKPAPGRGAAVVHHPLGAGELEMDAGAGSSSSGGGGGTGMDASTQSRSFACGSVMCMAPGQYCSVTMTGFGNNTNYECTQAPFSCSSGATCACVQQSSNPFDSGGGCSCSSDSAGHVTLTCIY